ncbi:unnamed protein product [Haemonchus placei]|uniref:Uncharacterized protein n=1 Tax=Haemonchus placei TaxID=6290 RepID=A0A3P7UA44_HAEPC|nr:unnamed protein product [Haemonchus placei]
MPPQSFLEKTLDVGNREFPAYPRIFSISDTSYGNSYGRAVTNLNTIDKQETPLPAMGCSPIKVFPLSLEFRCRTSRARTIG